MLIFRIPFYEHRVYKEYLPKADMLTVASKAFFDKLDQGNASIANVRHIDSDSVEIVKRFPKKVGLMYNLGVPQQGTYERVIINRKTHEVAIDRMDQDYHRRGVPYSGQRDLFYFDEDKQKVAVVRHIQWVHKIMRPYHDVTFELAAFNYERKFK